MTATASCSVRQTIRNKFGSLDVQEIVESPDRVNIKLHMQKFPSCLSNAELLQSLIDNLTKRKHECCRVLIFCQSVSDCGKLYVTFMTNLPQHLMCHVEMYHSETLVHVKDSITRDMSIVNGTIKILICTSAAGMGVNFVGVDHVVHYGPPKNVDDLLQQLGRAGRDGKQAHHLLLYCPRQCRDLSDEVKEYLKCTTCYRKQLMSYYGGQDELSMVDKHVCCTYCALSCCCANSECESGKTHPIFTMPTDETESISDSSSVEDLCEDFNNINVFETEYSD